MVRVLKLFYPLHLMVETYEVFIGRTGQLYCILKIEKLGNVQHSLYGSGMEWNTYTFLEIDVYEVFLRMSIHVRCTAFPNVKRFSLTNPNTEWLRYLHTLLPNHSIAWRQFHCDCELLSWPIPERLYRQRTVRSISRDAPSHDKYCSRTERTRMWRSESRLHNPGISIIFQILKRWMTHLYHDVHRWSVIVDHYRTNFFSFVNWTCITSSNDLWASNSHSHSCVS